MHDPTEEEDWRFVERPGAEGTLAAFRRDVVTHGGDVMRNPAIWHMAVYRFGNWSLGLQRRPVRWVTSKAYGVMSLVSERLTGVHMDRRTRIGEDFHIVHAEAPISIHPHTVIGDRVGIMHGVTIGTNVDSEHEAPVIGNDVFIGVGAVVVGGITIGDNVSIAANSLVTTDVPDNSVAVGVPAKIYPRLKLAKKP